MSHCCTIFRQVTILAWKNAKLKFRHFSTLILELVIPIGMMMALWGIKLANKPKFSGPTIPVTGVHANDIRVLYSDNSYSCFSGCNWHMNIKKFPDIKKNCNNNSDNTIRHILDIYSP